MVLLEKRGLSDLAPAPVVVYWLPLAGVWIFRIFSMMDFCLRMFLLVVFPHLLGWWFLFSLVLSHRLFSPISGVSGTRSLPV